jgi:aspartyl-tRNA(Asn)/glutamyl-tRNA(Gln) amidotransferase subunit A
MSTKTLETKPDRGPAADRTSQSLATIERLDSELRACVLVRREALDEAAAVDRRSLSGPLAGLTVAVKDNMDVEGTVRTDGLGPPFTSPAVSDCLAVQRLRAAGAVVVAKANLEQLSFGATTQNPTFGACRNPWDKTRIPGGSSGGSAVAVAAGMVDAALGTDTGGSLRNPASFCGVSTLRPTQGLVPTAGVTPLSPSMDVVGPLARSVRAIRDLLNALAGHRGRETKRSLLGLRVGVPEIYFLEELDADVARSFDEFLRLLRHSGARLSSVPLPGVREAVEAMPILQNSEAAESLRSYWDDVRLSEGIRERLNLGRSATPADLAAANRIASSWRRAVAQALEQVSVLATPATPFVAPPIASDNLVQLSRRINRLTGCWSLVGTPALVIPLQRSQQGLPIGGQLIGPRGADWQLLSIGTGIQDLSDWHCDRPAGVDLARS